MRVLEEREMKKKDFPFSSNAEHSKRSSYTLGHFNMKTQ